MIGNADGAWQKRKQALAELPEPGRQLCRVKETEHRKVVAVADECSERVSLHRGYKAQKKWVGMMTLRKRAETRGWGRVPQSNACKCWIG